MMEMIVDSLKEINLDSERGFKSLFITNALDGTEDHLVSDRIFSLVGPSVVEFRDELMKKELPKSFEDMLKTITPPQGK